MRQGYFSRLYDMLTKLKVIVSVFAAEGWEVAKPI